VREKVLKIIKNKKVEFRNQNKNNNENSYPSLLWIFTNDEYIKGLGLNQGEESILNELLGFYILSLQNTSKFIPKFLIQMF